MVAIDKLKQIADIGFDIATVAGVIVAFCVWVKKRVSQRDISDRFIKAIATNHLPHIYHALTLIQMKLGIASSEPSPNIDFVDLTK